MTQARHDLESELLPQLREMAQTYQTAIQVAEATGDLHHLVALQRRALHLERYISLLLSDGQSAALKALSESTVY